MVNGANGGAESRDTPLTIQYGGLTAYGDPHPAWRIIDETRRDETRREMLGTNEFGFPSSLRAFRAVEIKEGRGRGEHNTEWV